jgi:hypothetical protein
VAADEAAQRDDLRGPRHRREEDQEVAEAKTEIIQLRHRQEDETDHGQGDREPDAPSDPLTEEHEPQDRDEHHVQPGDEPRVRRGGPGEPLGLEDVGHEDEAAEQQARRKHWTKRASYLPATREERQRDQDREEADEPGPRHERVDADLLDAELGTGEGRTPQHRRDQEDPADVDARPAAQRA